MSRLSKELLYLVLQYLHEENYKETVHRLESESGRFLNVKYIEELVKKGEWEALERYLSGFISVGENRYSLKILFEIRKQKYLEALERKDRVKALNILNQELKVFQPHNDALFKEMTLLLTLGDIRENALLSKYTDNNTARLVVIEEIKKLIAMSPELREKSQFPSVSSSRLRQLVNQSLNWQHQLCKFPKANPDMTTLLVDHTCGPSNAAHAPPHSANHQFVGPIPRPGFHPPMQQPEAQFLFTATRGQSSVNTPALTCHPNIGGDLVLATHSNGAAEPELVLKRARPLRVPEEIRSIPSLSVSRPNHGVNFLASEELPTNVITLINQGSNVKSLDFHPEYQTLLLVGTDMGDISLWEIGSRLRIAHRSFSVWNVRSCSFAFQAFLGNHQPVYVNRVKWSPDGLFMGVAYSMHVVHVFSYHAGQELKDHLEIEAHVGSVSDVAFSTQEQSVLMITCGEDRTIKIWDTATGARQHILEGHDAPIYSILPHYKANIKYILSTAMDGKIRVWLYDEAGPRIEYDAPGSTCTRLAYNSDGSRLFSLGTSNDGVSFLVEWNESDGNVKQSYSGLTGKHSPGSVHFDIAKRFLAVGDNFCIKFWDMDKQNQLTSTNADGGLSATPCIRFNKDGVLLAASTADKGVKILGNAEGYRLVRSIENQSESRRVVSGAVAKPSTSTTFVGSNSAAGASVGTSEIRTPSPAVPTPNQDSQNMSVVRSRGVDELVCSAVWTPKEITEPSELRSMRLLDNLVEAPIVKLLYTNTGSGVLALAYNAVHKLWKWQKTEQNPTGNATTEEAPRMWQPTSGILMINDIRDVDTDTAVPCLAISKNNSYVISSSGGKVSLYNMTSFKTLTSFIDHPPAPTSLVFNPQDNNIIAIGLADCTIQIFNIRLDQALQKLVGHQKFVTGLAYDIDKKILVSSGADAQICIWNTENWEKVTSKYLNIPFRRNNNPSPETRVYFNLDRTRLLVVHESQIALYDPENLEFLMQWFPQQACGSITDAVYSCDGEYVYVSMEDGSVNIVTSIWLKLTCRITSAAYLPPKLSAIKVCINAIAAHPLNPKQFALGISDGGVYVVEPLESEKDWGSECDEKVVGTSENPVAVEP
ncbi:topless-related protein 4-like [Rutidosis leptorrhynchoides]|uniref:topless-related protein 4-like n=1 Tax=Rutidosis leptorrhynchoides TaxID=125765 RepID=UPI003A9A4148